MPWIWGGGGAGMVPDIHKLGTKWRWWWFQIWTSLLFPGNFMECLLLHTFYQLIAQTVIIKWVTACSKVILGKLKLTVLPKIMSHFIKMKNWLRIYSSSPDNSILSRMPRTVINIIYVVLPRLHPIFPVFFFNVITFIASFLCSYTTAARDVTNWAYRGSETWRHA